MVLTVKETGEGIWKHFVPSFQLFYKSKIILKYTVKKISVIHHISVMKKNI